MDANSEQLEKSARWDKTYHEVQEVVSLLEKVEGHHQENEVVDHVLVHGTWKWNTLNVLWLQWL